MVKALDFLHSNDIVHRDVKPENLLVNKTGLLKVCDFGFARSTLPNQSALYTDYVSTRWYRSPELLVGDANYDKTVDIWAIGCIYAEMFNGMPLFPGDSDLHTLKLILDMFGDDQTLTDK
jgi:cyclin-dependent kinase-like